MMKINDSITVSVTHVAPLGSDRLTLHMEDDLEKAVSIFRKVEVIEVESLSGHEIYVATSESGAEIISLHRVNGVLSVTLKGIKNAN